jgi:hypothetical protein
MAVLGEKWVVAREVESLQKKLSTARLMEEQMRAASG